MAKQHPPSAPQGALNITLYEVRLVCAVPDYGVGSATAIDYILEGAIDEITVIDSDETTLRVVRNNEASEAVPAKQQATTLGEDEDSLVQAITTNDKPAKRKQKKWKAYKPSPKVAKRIETVHAALRALTEASADDIATVTSIPVKLVYNALYALHDAKQIGAVKAHGKVRWFAVKQ
jgi:hypothetical protein